MSYFSGTIPVLGTIAPGNTIDTYPTHDAVYGKGGSMQVATIEERDAIPVERRVLGMLVTVHSNTADAALNGIYTLEGDITNFNWVFLKDSNYFDITLPEIDTTEFSYSIVSSGAAPTVRPGGTALEAGDFWFDPTTTSFYIYYIDVDTSQWVQINENRAI